VSDAPKRPSKRSAREGARRLRQQADWDPEKVLADRRNARERLSEVVQDARAEKVYSQSDDCAECKEARQELDDETALCELHLLSALGMG